MKLSEIEGYDHLYVADRKHVITLLRRKAYLEKQVALRGLGWDKAELSALRFALKYVSEARGYCYEKKTPPATAPASPARPEPYV
jgi:hypothetical protein